MAVKRRPTTYQYEPLVTPSKWQGDELRFSVRLTQILDDLYQKFSSLRTGSGSASVAIADDANKLGGVEASKYALKTGTVANANNLGGKAPEYYLRTVNLLDNSDFSNPINQRGNNYQQTNWEYFIDRWILAGSNGTAVSYDINSSDKAVGVSTESGEDIYLVQRIEKNKIDTTKTYTAVYQRTDGQVWVDNNVVFEELEDSYQLVLVVPSETYLKWAALYEGEYTAETLPPYVPKPYAVELAECQRYYVRLRSGNAFYGFVGSSGSIAYLYFDLPQQMRISNPTATTTGRFFLRAYSGSVSASTISKVDTFGKQLEISVAVSMTADKPFNGYAESSVEVSADL